MTKDAWMEGSFAQNWDAVNAARDNPDRANQLDLLITLLVSVWGRMMAGCWIWVPVRGRWEPSFSERIPHASIVCLDSSEEMLKLASERLHANRGQISSASGDMNRLGAVEFPHAPYAAVFSSQALHEISHESKTRCLRKSVRMLRPGGAFYILDRFQTRFDDLPDAYERVWNRQNRVWMRR